VHVYVLHKTGRSQSFDIQHKIKLDFSFVLKVTMASICTATAVLLRPQIASPRLLRFAMNVHAVSPQTAVNKVFSMLFLLQSVQPFHGKEAHISYGNV
jgi:hypothetical protein